jgi:hypothetical protein
MKRLSSQRCVLLYYMRKILQGIYQYVKGWLLRQTRNIYIPSYIPFFYKFRTLFEIYANLHA